MKLVLSAKAVITDDSQFCRQLKTENNELDTTTVKQRITLKLSILMMMILNVNASLKKKCDKGSYSGWAQVPISLPLHCRSRQ